MLLLVPVSLSVAFTGPANGQPASGTSWPMFRGDPALTGVAESPLPERLGVRWRRPLGEAIEATAAIADGRVYVGAADGVLYALDFQSGDPAWRYKAQGPIRAAATVHDGTVYVGDETGVFHAVDAQSGERRWQFETEGEITSGAVPHGDRILFGSYDARLYCLDAGTGREVWRYETDDFIHATPALVDDHVLVSGCDGRLSVVRATDGTLARQVDLGAPSGSSAATRGELAIIATQGCEVLGVDWKGGEVRWRYQHADREFPYISSAAVDTRRAYLGGRDKRFRALDLTSGKQLWEFATRRRIDSSAVVAGKRVYFGASDGNLYALDRDTGEEGWRFEAGTPITASPAVAGGCLVIGTESGDLYCFGAPASAADRPAAQP